MSRLVAPSFSLANSLIWDDVSSAARKHHKSKSFQAFSEGSFTISCSIFLREESIVKKTKNDSKKIGVGDLNLGMVSNWKHIFFCLALFELVWTVGLILLTDIVYWETLKS